MRTAAFAVALFATVGVARAEMSAADAVAGARKKTVLAISIISGVGQGLSWANVELGSRGKPLLFCAPEQMALTWEQEVDVIDRYLKRYPANAEFPVGAVMLYALMDALPCKSN